jgi:spermidine synthase
VGYGYAHVISSRPPRAQRVLHIALLAVSVLWAAGLAVLRPALKAWMGNSGYPALEVLFCVLVFVGLPYVLLSANSTLIQAWLARARHGSEMTAGAGGRLGAFPEVSALNGRDGSPSRPQSSGDQQAASGEASATDSRSVYKLYAVSNLGSLLGLLAYPFVLEPWVSLTAQWWGFAACLLIYVLFMALLAKGTEHGGPRREGCDPASDLGQHSSNLPLSLARPWLWFALPALSTFLLNAVTMHLSTDVTPVPMMWVLLLAAYLVSYMIGFSVVGEKGLIVWALLAAPVLAGAAYVGGLSGGRGFLPNLALGVATVGVCCVFLHGWLYRIRPVASHLTRFYLGIAAGGAVGGACASLVAPAVFQSVAEYPFALAATACACAGLLYVWDHPEVRGVSRFMLGVCAASLVLSAGIALKAGTRAVCQERNFYGCLEVRRDFLRTTAGGSFPTLSLYHGSTVHGYQVKNPYFSGLPTTYYGEKGGGLAVRSHMNSTNGLPMRVGLIGLGAGTMACYGRTGDIYRFFEINPQVVTLASDTNLFTYLSDSKARVEVRLGDARKTLESERRRGEAGYDVLVVDAYSGDSVPYHLASLEAFRLYADRLLPHGILAVHVSNWHIDLLPLCKVMARELGLHATGVISPSNGLTSDAFWVFMTRAPRAYDTSGAREVNWDDVRAFQAPKDECGSLLRLVRFGYLPPMKAMEFDFSHGLDGIDRK